MEVDVGSIDTNIWKGEHCNPLMILARSLGCRDPSPLSVFLCVFKYFRKVLRSDRRPLQQAC